MPDPIVEFSDYLGCVDPPPRAVVEAAYAVPSVVDSEAGLLRVTFDCLIQPLGMNGGPDRPSTRFLVFGGKGLSAALRIVRAWPNSRIDGRTPTHENGLSVFLCLGYGETVPFGVISGHRFEYEPVPTGPASFLFVDQSDPGGWKARTEWVML
jgi:hypothetical protein